MAIARRDLNLGRFAVLHIFEREVDVALRRHQLQAVAAGEFVFHRHRRQLAPALAGKFADELLALGNGVAVFVVLIAVVGVAAQEAFGVAAVGQAFESFQQRGIERPAGGGIVDGLAVDLGGTGAVVEGLGATLNFQRMDAHLRQTLDVGDSAQIF